MDWKTAVNFDWWNALRRSRSGRILATTGGSPSARPQPPCIWIRGDPDHPDFRDAVAMLRADARVDSSISPELIVVAQSRPDTVSHGDFVRWQREAPLAGIVSLLGSWCEGETRTGKPWKGAHRVFWYDFPAWWRMQMRLRNAGRCPDWARAPDVASRIAGCGLRIAIVPVQHGLIVVRTPRRETALALSDLLGRCGYSAVWQRPDKTRQFVSGAVAAIWDGGQLDDCEVRDLAGFCAQMKVHAAPVVALLDFPRRDRVDIAIELGAAAVIGKPWLNGELIDAIEAFTSYEGKSLAA